MRAVLVSRAIAIAALVLVGVSPASAAPPAAEQINVCGQLSSFTPQEAQHPTAVAALVVSGRSIDFQLAGPGNVIPQNISSLGSALVPINARLSGVSDGSVVREWTLERVASCASPVAPVQSASGAFPCGRVTAFTPPTATSTGSITLGTNTFVLAAGSLPAPPPPIAVGALTCLSGEQNAAGEFLATTTLVGDTVCGTVTAFTPATASSAGSITMTAGRRTVTIPVRTEITLASSQTTGTQCFTFGFNAAGNAEVTGSAATQTAPSQLPSTSTSSDAPGGAAAVLVLLMALGVTAAAAFRSATRRIS